MSSPAASAASPSGGGVWVRPRARAVDRDRDPTRDSVRDGFGARRDACREFHARLPGYAPTPMHDVPVLAERLGVGTVLVKDESRRFDLPAFKILGASWGAYRSLCHRLGGCPPWTDVSELGRRLAPLGRPCLLAATAGNHGRALARMARWLGLPSLILLPAVTEPRAAAEIETEGAAVRWVEGDYDAAVAAAADLAGRDPGYLLVQDTSWSGYQRVPTWIVEGYRTLFSEIDDQLAARGAGRPDAVVVPVGVGSLLSAAVRHYLSESIPEPWQSPGPGATAASGWCRAAPSGGSSAPPHTPLEHGEPRHTRTPHRRSPPPHSDSTIYRTPEHRDYSGSPDDPGQRAGPSRPGLLAVEPVTAACLLASLRAGRRVTVGTAATVMDGLNAGTVSPIAWPLLRGGVDAAVAVTDAAAHAAGGVLGGVGITAGPCGAATLAGLSAALSGPDRTAVRRALGLTANGTVVLLGTDGVHTADH